MEKKKTSLLRRSFVSSLLALLLCVAMLVGTTYAWFTDSVTSGTNRIVAGDLDIDLLMYKGSGYTSIANGTGDIFKEAGIAQNSSATLWEPGKTQVVFLAVQNKGTLALKYNAYIDVTDEGLIGSLEYAWLGGVTKEAYDSANIKSWSEIEAYVAADTTSQKADLAKGRTVINTGVLDEIAKGIENECDYIALAVHMKEEAGNEYQGKDAIIDISIVATQMTAESDSFDDQYDAGAATDVPATPVHESVVTDKGVKKETTDTLTFTASGDVKSATLEKASAAALFTSEESTDASKDMLLNLNVDTTETTEDSVTLDLTLYKTITTTANSVTTKGEATKVTETLNTYLTATIQLEVGLKDVAVTHSGNAMEALGSADATPTNANGGYYYNESTGLLTVKSKSFSPFKVTYSNAVCKIDSITYGTLARGLAAAKAGDTVVLLKDCSVLSDDVTANDNINIDGTGYTITRDTDEALKDFSGNSTALKYFAGGKGIENDPYEIYNYKTFKNIAEFAKYESNSYVGTYYYYEVCVDKCTKDADNKPIIDCGGSSLRVNLCGNFNGNGVSIINSGSNLFSRVFGNSSCTKGEGSSTIENLSVTFTYSDGGLIYWNTAKYLTLKNINVHGTIEASSNASSFIDFAGVNNSIYHEFVFNNCHSDATIIITGSSAGGYVGHPYSAKNSPFTFTNCSFTGDIYSSSGASKCYTFSGAFNSHTAVTFDGENWPIYTNYDQNKSHTIKVTSGTMPSKYDVFTATKMTGYDHAVAYLTIGPNGNGTTYIGGYYCSDYMTETSATDGGLVISENSITTTSIKYFDITSNGSATEVTGISSDGKTYNVVNSAYNNVIGGASVRIIQYDANNNILGITSWNITP